MFTLPKVSAKLKLKLTALEGSRVRRVSVAHFGSRRAEDYGEHHLAVLTNLGDIQVVSLPLLKPQVRYSCIRREDVSGIASCVFTKYGQGVRAGLGGCGGPRHCRDGKGGQVCCGHGQTGWALSGELRGNASPYSPRLGSSLGSHQARPLALPPLPRLLPDLTLGVRALLSLHQVAGGAPVSGGFSRNQEPPPW